MLTAQDNVNISPIEEPGVRPDKKRGSGGPLSTQEAKQNRLDARMERRAARNRWPMPPGALAKVANRAVQMVDSVDPKDVRIGMQTITEINKQNLTIDLEDDKADRLDEGKPTANQSIKVVYTNRIHEGDA